MGGQNNKRCVQVLSKTKRQEQNIKEKRQNQDCP